MSAAAQTDWFQENAPASGKDWFDENAPSTATAAPTLWQKANTPLVAGSSILNAVGRVVPKPPDMLPNETVSDYLKRSSTPGTAALNPEHPILAGIRAGLSGAASDLADTISSFTSPASIALAGTGVAARALPATGKLATAGKVLLRGGELGAAGAFGAQGVGQAAKADWTTPEGIAQGLQGAGQAALAGAGALDVAKAPFRQYIGLKSKAGQVFSNLDSAIGEAPVSHEPVMKAIQRVDDLGKKGYTVPKVVNDFTNWIRERQAPRIAPGPNGELIDTPGSSMPLSWKDGRDFYSAMNEAIDWNQIPDSGGKMRRAVMAVRNALDGELRSVASDNQVAGQYDQAMRDYAKSMQIQGLGWGIGKIAGRALGYMSPVHPWATGHIGAQVGGPAVGGMVRSVLESPTDIMQAAKEGQISPGEADRRISRMGQSVKVKPLVKEPPSPPPSMSTSMVPRQSVAATAPTSDINLVAAEPITSQTGNRPPVMNQIKVSFDATPEFLRKNVTEEGDWHRGLARKIFPGKAITDARMVNQTMFGGMRTSRGEHGLFVTFRNPADAAAALREINGQ